MVSVVSSKVCYRTVRRHYLLGAEFEKHDSKSINECRCLCAATYGSNSLNKCRSFQYYAIGGKCILNKDSHFGKYDLIEDIESIYQYVSCEPGILQAVASNMCDGYGKLELIATTTELPKTDGKQEETTTTSAATEASSEWPTTILSTLPSTTTSTTPQASETTTKNATTDGPISEAIIVFSKKFSTTTEGSNKVSFVTEPPSSEFPDDPFEGDKETTDEDGDPDEDLETSGSGSGDEDDELDMGLDNNEITASDEQKNDEELELEAESGSGSDGAHADGVRNHRGNRVAWQRAQRLRRLQAARKRNAKLKAQQRQKALQRKRLQRARERQRKRLAMQRKKQQLRREAKRLERIKKQIEREKRQKELELKRKKIQEEELKKATAFIDTTTKPSTTAEVTTEKVTETTTISTSPATEAPSSKPSHSPEDSGSNREKQRLEPSIIQESTTERPVTTTTAYLSPDVKAAIQRQKEFEEAENKRLNVEKHGCFERIYAGGLEHDVSIEECECHCATSRHSGKYGFQCTSTTYYHNERDCILNLEDRVMRPSLFEPQIANFNATYIGMICDHATAILKLPSYLNSETCKAPQQSTTTTTPTTTTTTKAEAKSETKKKKKKSDKADSCFLELTDFVLEGVALAVESNVNPQDCKCRCLEGEKKYGEPCQSFQYYYESETCLINRHNRFNNPEKFNYVPGPPARGYFENTCVGKDDMREAYLREICKIDDDEIVQGNLLNKEGEHKELKRDIEQTLKNSTEPSSETTTTTEASTKLPEAEAESVKMKKMEKDKGSEKNEEEEEEDDDEEEGEKDEEGSEEVTEASGSDEEYEEDDKTLTSKEEKEEYDDSAKTKHDEPTPAAPKKTDSFKDLLRKVSKELPEEVEEEQQTEEDDEDEEDEPEDKINQKVEVLGSDQVKLRKKKPTVFESKKRHHVKRIQHERRKVMKPENMKNKLVVTNPESETSTTSPLSPLNLPRYSVKSKKSSSRKTTSKPSGIPEAEGMDSLESTLESEIETTLATELEDHTKTTTHETTPESTKTTTSDSETTTEPKKRRRLL
ncbi:hypothetical protein WR25_24947 isoform C [Diploscapter pachys]|uniref:Apple domain-containing protein n=1 Tax=Diploscapter pachys TaxID=2018661 RepID=A0A2A2J211_9BILA|nr:hypothetical protein WR25_24947 isoform C [Diploscapter pachys]